jgi:drug/metabolite transporter (DMT)-like permease
MKSTNTLGVGFVVLALLTFSLQDIAVKSMGGHYPVLEIVIFRTLFSIPCTLLFFYGEGKRGLPTTSQLRLELVRGFFLFLSFTTYMMALAALPLAEIASIRNSGPLIITLLSVLWLKDHVGARHWIALVLGFIGVLLIVKPGSASFNLGSVFILLSTLFYALSVMLTRQLRSTDSSATMAFYSSLVYLVVALILAPISLLVGEIPNAHPSIAFLFRAWSTPSLLDAIIICGLGLVWAGGMYCMARAYSLARASLIAPFEYIALPINAMWGFVIWHEFPTPLTWAGALLTLLSGFFILSQEQQKQVIKLEEINAIRSD